MAYDQLRNAIEGIRSQLQAELEAQLTLLERQQQEAIEAARRAADVEAHERWMVQLEQVRADRASRLETELAAAAADADRRTVAECTRARLETEQAAAESIAQIRTQSAAETENLRSETESLRSESQKQIAEERERAEHAIASAQERIETLERERETENQRAGSLQQRAEALDQELEQVRSQLESTAAQARESSGSVAEARLAERQAQLAAVERLLDSVRAIADAQTLTDALDALVAGAAGEAPRVAVLIVNGDELQAFRVSGFDEAAAAARVQLNGSGALQDAIASAAAVPVPAAAAPDFAAMPAGRAGLAVPIAVGNRPVAVLYADDVSDGEPAAPASWPEALQILCRHASVALGHLTAIRTAQAMQRGSSAASRSSTSAAGAADDDQAARRYAKLLVSEIKLYNEVAVRVGREKRDLLTRLQPEVERARRLYEERVPAAVAGRGQYFQQELVHTLADGDPSLLGNFAVPS
jgi:hypothetical protein